MFPRPSHHLLSLSQAQMSEAFLCLTNQSEPPSHLSPLSLEDWILLAALLDNLLEEKKLNVLH